MSTEQEKCKGVNKISQYSEKAPSSIIIIRCLNIVSPQEIGLRPVKLAVIEDLLVHL